MARAPKLSHLNRGGEARMVDVSAKPATDEYAVMIDARDALQVGDAASATEFAGYVDSWKAPGA